MEYEKLQKIADHKKEKISKRDDACLFHRDSIYRTASREMMDVQTVCEGVPVNFNFRFSYVDVVGITMTELKMIQDMVFEERIRQ